MFADSDDSELQVHDDSISVELLSLIAALSLQYVDEVYGRRKGKAVDGPPSDEELALQLFAEEARALQVYAQDIELAQSIANADAELVAQYVQIEEFERRDREAAVAMSRAGSESPTVSMHSVPSSTAIRTSIQSVPPQIQHVYGLTRIGVHSTRPLQPQPVLPRRHLPNNHAG